MKKENLMKLLPTCISGVLLVFLSIVLFEAGGGTSITLGVFSLLIGLAFIVFNILLLVKPEGPLADISALVFDLGYPLYMFLSALMMIIQLADYLDVNGWIIYLLILLSGLGFVVFRLVAKFVTADGLVKLAFLLNMVFLAAVVLSFVFSPLGGLKGLGDISILDIVLFACFTMMSLGSFKSSKE